MRRVPRSHAGLPPKIRSLESIHNLCVLVFRIHVAAKQPENAKKKAGFSIGKASLLSTTIHATALGAAVGQYVFHLR